MTKYSSDYPQSAVKYTVLLISGAKTTIWWRKVTTYSTTQIAMWLWIYHGFADCSTCTIKQTGTVPTPLKYSFQISTAFLWRIFTEILCVDTNSYRVAMQILIILIMLLAWTAKIHQWQSKYLFKQKYCFNPILATSWSSSDQIQTVSPANWWKVFLPFHRVGNRQIFMIFSVITA
jgi:hypothetical protein